MHVEVFDGKSIHIAFALANYKIYSIYMALCVICHAAAATIHIHMCDMLNTLRTGNVNAFLNGNEYKCEFHKYIIFFSSFQSDKMCQMVNEKKN